LDFHVTGVQTWALPILPGVRLYLQAGQDINVGGRRSRSQYQYTLTSANLEELNTWAPRLLARFHQLPQLTDLATDQQNNANTARSEERRGVDTCTAQSE